MTTVCVSIPEELTPGSIVGKICAVNAGSLKPNYACKAYKETMCIEENLVVYDNCEIVTGLD